MERQSRKTLKRVMGREKIFLQEISEALRRNENLLSELNTANRSPTLRWSRTKFFQLPLPVISYPGDVQTKAGRDKEERPETKKRRHGTDAALRLKMERAKRHKKEEERDTEGKNRKESETRKAENGAEVEPIEGRRKHNLEQRLAEAKVRAVERRRGKRALHLGLS